MLKRLLMLAAIVCSTASLHAQDSSASDRSAERESRGLTSYNNAFVAKGQWAVGASMSYSTHSNDNFNLVIIENIESTGYNFDVSSMFAYAFADNNSVGARVNYSRNLLRLDNSDVIIGDEESTSGVNFSLDDCYLLTHSYSMMAILRQYIPLGNNKRFALYNEVQLEGGGSQSKYSYDSPVQGTYSSTTSFGLNFAPGVTAFISNRVALEINVGAMGFNFSKTTQTHNQVYTGESSTNMFNFKVNILSMGFGITYYL